MRLPRILPPALLEVSIRLLGSLATDPHCTISRVLLDDADVHGGLGGGYAKYGIDERVGAIVVVRPDGYVGTVAPLDGIDYLNSYFAAFLL